MVRQAPAAVGHHGAMARPAGPVDIRRIRPDEGQVLRELRLAALQDAPTAFSSTFGAEAAFTDSLWEERARRGAAGDDLATLVAVDGERPVGLVVGLREPPGAPDVELVSMWTAPGVRRRGVARALAQALLDWAGATGAAEVRLWVTRGNVAAERLYAGLGFLPTGASQPLPSDPAHTERRLARTVP